MRRLPGPFGTVQHRTVNSAVTGQAEFWAAPRRPLFGSTANYTTGGQMRSLGTAVEAGVRFECRSVTTMTTWKEFTESAPRIAAIFTRRHAATGNLCLLATLRSDGFPRISPIEPRVFEDQLWIVGMPGTTKFRDLGRDPRFCLHTATIDTEVTDGDAKLWGVVNDIQDKPLHQRFATALFEDIGLDLRGRDFDHFYAADVTGASAVEVGGGHMDVTIWKPGEPERVVRKH